MSCDRRVCASAPGKIILLGEHAAVYGEPAIAAPVSSVRAFARATQSDGVLAISALDLKRRITIDHADAEEPLAALLRLTADYLRLDDPKGEIQVQSAIPAASGMGSSAAVSAAVARALAKLHGRELADEALNELVYEIERLHHGMPSGIDNTVVVYEEPIMFAKGSGLERLQVGAPFRFIVADTGIAASTREAVAKVRRRFEADREATRDMFNSIGRISEQGKGCLAHGDAAGLGKLMNQNHALLRRLGVSSPELEALVAAAIGAGALGAKLSGGGLGGNMIALVEPESSDAVAEALKDARAARVLPFCLNQEADDG